MKINLNYNFFYVSNLKNIFSNTDKYQIEDFHIDFIPSKILYKILIEDVITMKQKDIYFKILNKLVEHPKYCYFLIHYNMILTPTNNFYDRALKKCFENKHFVRDLIINLIITEANDLENWKRGIEICLESNKVSYDLINYDILNESHTKFWDRAIQNCLKKSDYSFQIINNKTIKRGNKYWDKAIKNCLKKKIYCYRLLRFGIIDKTEELIYYYYALSKCLKDPDICYELINNFNITENDLYWNLAMEKCLENPENAKKLIENKVIHQKDKYFTIAYDLCKIHFQSD